MFKHRDNRDYLELNQIPYFVHLFNWKENTIKCTKNSGVFCHRGAPRIVRRAFVRPVYEAFDPQQFDGSGLQLWENGGVLIV